MTRGRDRGTITTLRAGQQRGLTIMIGKASDYSFPGARHGRVDLPAGTGARRGCHRPRRRQVARDAWAEHSNVGREGGNDLRRMLVKKDQMSLFLTERIALTSP